MKHTGSLVSGTITCSCGNFTTIHHVIAADAVAEFNRHLDDVEPGWRDADAGDL